MERIKANMLKTALQLRGKSKEWRNQDYSKTRSLARQGLFGSRVEMFVLNGEPEISSLFQSSGQSVAGFELGTLSDVLNLLSEEEYSGGGR